MTGDTQGEQASGAPRLALPAWQPPARIAFRPPTPDRPVAAAPPRAPALPAAPRFVVQPETGHAHAGSQRHAHGHAHVEPTTEHAHGHSHDHAPAEPSLAPATRAHEHSHDHGTACAHDHGHDHAQAAAPTAVANASAHGHSHDHGHSHAAASGASSHGHDHGHGPGCNHDHEGGLGGLFNHHHDFSDFATDSGNRRILKQALVLQAVFLVCEVVGGLAFNSLALLSDAAHMLADVGAFGLALFAVHMAARPVTTRRTWGFARAEVLAALANCVTLVVASVWIVAEAVHRMTQPEVVQGGGVAVIAAVGVAVNLATAGILVQGDRSNLNIKATLTHTLIDAVSCVGVLISGAIVATTGYAHADTIASLLIAAMAIRGTWGILRTSIDLLLDTAPDDCDVPALAAALTAHPLVREVHDLHVWSIGQRQTALTAHVICSVDADVDRVASALAGIAKSSAGVGHATFQVLPERPSSQLEVSPRLSRASIAAARA